MAGDIVLQLRDTRYPGQHEMRRAAADEIDRLRAELRKIADPIQYFREYARQHDREIDGHMAVQISNDAGWLKSEAAKALSPAERGSPHG